MFSAALKILHPRANTLAFSELSALSWRHKELVWEMTRRDILERYAGQVLGGVWAVANPLLIMAVYVFAFTVLFQGRLTAQGDVVEFTAYVLAGLAPWIALAEVLGRASTAVSGNASLVKQIVFPSQILPMKVALGALPTLFLGLLVTLLVAAVAGHAHVLGWVLLPIPIFCQLLMSTGFAFLLSAIGVFIRDIKDVVGVLLSIGFFLHPIVYAPGVAPRALEKLFYFSPFSYLLWCYRDAAFHGGITQPWIWLTMVLLSVGIFALGYRVYRMLQPSFGNAL
jgi:lipopolysaccharide transport system permease protein